MERKPLTISFKDFDLAGNANLIDKVVLVFSFLFVDNVIYFSFITSVIAALILGPINPAAFFSWFCYSNQCFYC